MKKAFHDALLLPTMLRTLLSGAVWFSSGVVVAGWTSSHSPGFRSVLPRQQPTVLSFHAQPLKIQSGPWNSRLVHPTPNHGDEYVIGAPHTLLWDSEGERQSDLVAAATASLKSMSSSSSSSSSSQSATAVLSRNNTETLSTKTLFSDAGFSAPPSMRLDDSVPHPTENGGYSHTRASKAKISAANRGKTPWNKGRKRTAEEKARIAAGVRAKNRERFLRKLADMNMTEAEYELQQKAEKEKRAAERRARRTEKGGYRPTNETRAKISAILKEKYASGEIVRRRNATDLSKVRRGFVQSEETRKKISESLKRRWATDPEYRANMMKNSAAGSSTEVRQKISETLRAKWKDPTFRAEMMAKIANRTVGNEGGRRNPEHRAKISETMKAKWREDEAYRKKTLDAINRKKELNARTRPPKQPRTAVPHKRPEAKVATKSETQVKSQKSAADEKDNMILTAVRAVKPKVVKKKSRKAKTQLPSAARSDNAKKVAKKKKKKKQLTPKPDAEQLLAPEHLMLDEFSADDPPSKANGRKKETGSVSQLRKERRDLYDLLYGDEDTSGENDFTSRKNSRSGVAERMGTPVASSSRFMSSVFDLEDENLDTFDPYGLEDF